jgi:hypothetical protein
LVRLLPHRESAESCMANFFVEILLRPRME